MSTTHSHVQEHLRQRGCSVSDLPSYLKARLANQHQDEPLGTEMSTRQPKAAVSEAEEPAQRALEHGEAVRSARAPSVPGDEGEGPKAPMPERGGAKRSPRRHSRAPPAEGFRWRVSAPAIPDELMPLFTSLAHRQGPRVLGIHAEASGQAGSEPVFRGLYGLIKFSGQSLGGNGFWGVAPQFPKTTPRSAPSTCPLRSTSEAAMVPWVGEENSDQLLQKYNCDPQSLVLLGTWSKKRLSIVPSDHARNSMGQRSALPGATPYHTTVGSVPCATAEVTSALATPPGWVAPA